MTSFRFSVSRRLKRAAVRFIDSVARWLPLRNVIRRVLSSTVNISRRLSLYCPSIDSALIQLCERLIRRVASHRTHYKELNVVFRLAANRTNWVFFMTQRPVVMHFCNGVDLMDDNIICCCSKHFSSLPVVCRCLHHYHFNLIKAHTSRNKPISLYLFVTQKGYTVESETSKQP